MDKLQDRRRRGLRPLDEARPASLARRECSSAIALLEYQRLGLRPGVTLNVYWQLRRNSDAKSQRQIGAALSSGGQQDLGSLTGTKLSRPSADTGCQSSEPG
jgi:hypothetical protein